MAVALVVLFVSHGVSAEEATLARAHLRGGGPAGGVFFLKIESAPGAVAVGAAHSFDRTRLAEAGEVEFRAATTGERVATSSRFLTMPGRAFHRRGGTLRDDFVTFALNGPPQGARILRAQHQLPREGERVRILGNPTHNQAGEADVVGTVVRIEADRIEVDLDAWADLRGWGGAPVLAADTGGVVGLLQSAWPSNGRLRAGVGPIGGVVDALAAPLDGGLGRLFATLAPTPSAANSPDARRRAATRSAWGDLSPERAAQLVAAANHAAAGRNAERSLALRLAIEHPPPETEIGDAAGVFLAGRAVALPPETQRFDIMIVIDTSESTNLPADVDVDGDGAVGQPLPDGRRGLAGPLSSDPDDSILAAEVAAARRLLAGLDPRVTRVGLVTFAGEALLYGPSQSPRLHVRRAALTQEPLTSDYRRLHRALDVIAEHGGAGMTYMTAGIDQASLELMGLPGALSGGDPESEKVILFFTDGQPTLPDVSSASANVRSVMQAAHRARDAGIRIYAFALGPEALQGPVAAVEMAAISNGLFMPVRHPGSLVRFVEEASFAAIEAVEVRNTSTGERAYQVQVHPDGSWDALVPLEEGENRIEVRARSRDGQEAVRFLTVRQVPGAPDPLIPAELVPKHNQQLALRLAELRAENLEALRRELTLEIERERAAALERAARQRKELKLEVEEASTP